MAAEESSRLRDAALTLAVVVESVPQLLPDALTVAVSLLVGFGVTEWALGFAVDVAFLAAVFYGFAPAVFSAVLRQRRGTRGFRLLVTAVSLLFGVPLFLVMTTTGRFDPTSLAWLGYLAGATVAGCLLVLAYFRRTQSTPLSDPDGDAVAVVVARTSRSPEEYRQVQERVARERPVLARVRTGILLGAAAATYVGPCMLFGLAAATLNSAFPALELLVLGGLVAGRLRARRGATGRGPGGGAADVEERVYDRLTAAVVTTRGTAGVLMAAVGAAVSVFLLVPWAAAGEPAAGLVVARWRFAARLATGTVATAPDVGTVAALTDALVATGSMVALPVAAGHAAWYWTRALRRFSALVEDGPGGAAPVARVPGLALPATGLVVAWSAYVARFDLALPVEAAFALAWPPLVAAAAWSTLAAWRGTPQSLAGTGRRLVAAHVTFVVGVVAGFGFLVGMTGIRRALLVPVMATWIYYLDPVRAASEETGGGALRVGYAALPLVAALLLRPVVPPGLPVLALFAALPVATAVGVGLRRASEA